MSKRSFSFPCIFSLALNERNSHLIRYWLLSLDAKYREKDIDFLECYTCNNNEDTLNVSKVFFSILSSKNKLHFISYTKEEEKICQEHLREFLSFYYPVFLIQSIENLSEANARKVFQNLFDQGIIAFWPFQEKEHEQFPIHLPLLAIEEKYNYTQVFCFSKNKHYKASLRQTLLLSGYNLRTDLSSNKSLLIAIEELLKMKNPKEKKQYIILCIDLNSIDSSEQWEWIQFLESLENILLKDMDWKDRLEVLYLQDPFLSQVSLDLLQHLNRFFNPRIFHPYEFLLLILYLSFEIKEKFLWKAIKQSPLDLLERSRAQILSRNFSSSFFPFSWLWNLLLSTEEDAIKMKGFYLKER